MTVIVWVTIAILTISAVLGIIRLILATDEATAAAVSDLIYFCAVGTFIMIAALLDSSVLFDVASIAALLGILATVALSRILTRGRR